MKKLIFSALLSLGMISFTGCTTGNDANAGAKCPTSKKCAAKKLDTATKKCGANGKCSAGKCVSK